MDNNDVYIDNGYKNRQEYLKYLAEDYGNCVYLLADMLGSSEDFDGLISALEDSEGEDLDY